MGSPVATVDRTDLCPRKLDELRQELMRIVRASGKFGIRPALRHFSRQAAWAVWPRP